MALDFPSSPTVGQIYGLYRWDGEKWIANAPASLVSGTVVLFYQAAAPTGWTKLTTQNDKALRVVSGTGGVAGGTNSFSSVMAQTVVGGHSLTAAQTGYHVHHNYYSVGHGGGTGWTYFWEAGGWYLYYSITGGAAGSGAAHDHTILMNMQYVDIILASKD